ncbi:MAG: hypothetical protein ACKO3R_00330 [bacterium]
MDGDGKVGDGELKGLEELGVKSISTKFTGQVGSKIDANGNDISLESTFTRVVDGEEKTLKTVNAFFVTDAAERFRQTNLSSKLAEAEANKQAYVSELSSTVVLSRKDSLTADISSIDSEIENLRSQIDTKIPF